MHHPNFKEKIAASPCIFTIGVAGDSGSGKTTFTQGVRNIFGNDLVSTITLDDYHSLDRDGRKEQGITALNPRANRIGQLEQDLISLKRGVPVEKPSYNHATGTFDPPAVFRPKKILILEGLHTLFTPTLRKYLDFTLFVDPAKSVKYDWKILRDVKQRGYSHDTVIKEIAEREPEYERYIAPQKEYADAVIGIDYSRYGQQLGKERNVYKVTLSQDRMKQSIENIDLSLDLYSILSLSDRNFSLEFVTNEQDGHRMGNLIIDGELSEHVVKKLEHSIEEQTRVHPISIFKQRNYVTAGDLAQLILCWRIIHRRIFIETCRY
ncbi:MAG: uridine kinase [Methanomicrobiales archaeon HGW-Methanomicrobiales-1]|nr:MAG: uridine kinase [Methanomicrobiales archaeon HGW-Methanomicrobiales-1]